MHSRKPRRRRFTGFRVAGGGDTGLPKRSAVSPGSVAS